MSKAEIENGVVYQGDNREVLKGLDENSIDSIVTDPPYGLSKEPKIEDVLKNWLEGNDYHHGGGGFMGKSWDSFVPGPSYWRECYRVLKPGGYLLCFASTRTFDLMAIALRLSGFECHPYISWIFGSGFPKATSLSKMLDKAAGIAVSKDGYMPNGKNSTHGKNWGGGHKTNITAPATEAARQWDGWSYGKQSLKPAQEPILMFQKPTDGKMVENVLKWGVGAVNVDGCRVAHNEPNTCRSRYESGLCHEQQEGKAGIGYTHHNYGKYADDSSRRADQGRWPANIIHDGSECVVREFPVTGPACGGSGGSWGKSGGANSGWKRPAHEKYESPKTGTYTVDAGGSAARFFYCAKPSKSERTANGQLENKHPTIKPLKLIEYLVKLVTPPGGTVLDPFFGSGTLGIAARRNGFKFVGIEKEDDYFETAIARNQAEADNDKQLTMFN